MKRAQGIAKRWKEEKAKDNAEPERWYNKMKQLEDVLRYEYGRYKQLCFWCYEETLSYTEWLK
jgi:hypothetical protein